MKRAVRCCRRRGVAVGELGWYTFNFSSSKEFQFQECFKDVSRAFQGSFQWVQASRVFERSSKGISAKFQMCFKGGSRKFQGFQGRLKDVSMEKV